jgi:hypothetical protein
VIRDIILAHGDDPALAGLPPYQRAALDAIASCGTVAAGMHREVCDHCGDRRLVPNTCGNRSCPHCQGRERIAWVEARTAELLPCGYHHVVLTIPSQLRPAAKAFPRAFLGSLLKAASDVIDRLCRDPRYLGAEVGQLAVLHTWTRNLEWHPHVHIIVTAGGWDADHHRWVPAKTYGCQKRPFLMPVEVLRTAFARRLRTLLLRQARAGAFGDGGGLAELADATALAKHLDVLMAKPWVVRIEPPFGGPQTLLKYLGAYVSRTAIGPKRVTYDPAAGTATYTWRANASPEQEQSTTLPAVEFIKRFAQHILPPRFQRIRFRGLWSTAHRATKLDLARKAIDPAAPPPPKPAPHEPRCDPCPVCGQGRYQRIPGPCPRPPRRERARLLALIRSGELHPTHGRTTTAA